MWNPVRIAFGSLQLPGYNSPALKQMMFVWTGVGHEVWGAGGRENRCVCHVMWPKKRWKKNVEYLQHCISYSTITNCLAWQKPANSLLQIDLRDKTLHSVTCTVWFRLCLKSLGQQMQKTCRLLNQIPAFPTSVYFNLRRVFCLFVF